MGRVRSIVRIYAVEDLQLDKRKYDTNLSRIQYKSTETHSTTIQYNSNNWCNTDLRDTIGCITKTWNVLLT